MRQHRDTRGVRGSEQPGFMVRRSCRWRANKCSGLSGLGPSGVLKQKEAGGELDVKPVGSESVK